MGDNKSTIFLTMIFLIVLGVAIFRGSFVDKTEAVRALEIQGYSDVQISDQKSFFVGIRGCENTDAVRFDASAKNPAGRNVHLFVCVGWPFKGATIRTD